MKSFKILLAFVLIGWAQDTLKSQSIENTFLKNSNYLSGEIEPQYLGN